MLYTYLYLPLKLNFSESSLARPVIAVGIEKMKTSIETYGVGNRAKGRLLVIVSSDEEGKYFVVDGNHRFQAMLRLGRCDSLKVNMFM